MAGECVAVIDDGHFFWSENSGGVHLEEAFCEAVIAGTVFIDNLFYRFQVRSILYSFGFCILGESLDGG